MGSGRRYTREEVIDWLVATLNGAFSEELSAEVHAALPAYADDPYRNFSVTLRERLPDGSLVRAKQFFPIHISVEVEEPVVFGTEHLIPAARRD